MAITILLFLSQLGAACDLIGSNKPRPEQNAKRFAREKQDKLDSTRPPEDAIVID
jgi:hypothetical protein